MSVPQTHGAWADQVPLSVITAREKVEGNRWIEERWRVIGVIAGRAEDSEKIVRTVLRTGPDGEQYLWTGFVLRLRPYEADSYYYNIIGQNPSLYVYCRPDDTGEPCPHTVTAEYIEAMSVSETGNMSFAVPMPPEVYRVIEDYVLEHYEPDEPKMKRKRDNKRGERLDDD